MNVADLFWVALGCVVLTGWVGIVRALRSGKWPCPHCGRETCDRGCIERGED